MKVIETTQGNQSPEGLLREMETWGLLPKFWNFPWIGSSASFFWWSEGEASFLTTAVSVVMVAHLPAIVAKSGQ